MHYLDNEYGIDLIVNGREWDSNVVIAVPLSDACRIDYFDCSLQELIDACEVCKLVALF